jgi:hypothetical protein
MANRRVPSATVLVAANLVPLAGIALFGWDVFAVVFLFWLENVVVGFFNVLRMLWVERGAERMPAAKFAIIPFFVVHYGLFTGVHGVFVFALFGQAASISGFPTVENVIDVIVDYNLWVAVLALVLSHGFSFIRNYVAEQEYRRVTLQQLMAQPYRRVVVLHLTILFGGFLVMALELPAIAVALLVVLKIGVDLRAHLREHRRLQPATASPSSSSLVRGAGDL